MTASPASEPEPASEAAPAPAPRRPEPRKPRPGLAGLEVVDLGLVPYAEALRVQDERLKARAEGRAGDALLLLEHPHVITLGRNAREANVLAAIEELELRGVELAPTARGGDVTYHGPGQLVGWPVLLLPEGRRDVKAYVRDLEEVMLRTLATFGIAAGREPGLVGVWADGEKVGAIGVRISRWLTSHGFALNVSTDLDYFRLITPCGIAGRGVTSMARLRGGKAPAMDEVKRAAAAAFRAVFGAP